MFFHSRLQETKAGVWNECIMSAEFSGKSQGEKRAITEIECIFLAEPLQGNWNAAGVLHPDMDGDAGVCGAGQEPLAGRMKRPRCLGFRQDWRLSRRFRHSGIQASFAVLPDLQALRAPCRAGRGRACPSGPRMPAAFQRTPRPSPLPSRRDGSRTSGRRIGRNACLRQRRRP